MTAVGWLIDLQLIGNYNYFTSIVDRGVISAGHAIGSQIYLLMFNVLTNGWKLFMIVVCSFSTSILPIVLLYS